MSNIHLLTALACLLSITSMVAAADSKEFEARVQRDAAGNALPYRIFKPANYDPNKKYPLILFLHGAGERGTNNTAQVRDALYFSKDEVQAIAPCFVVAPQCPVNRPAFQLYGTKKELDGTYADYEKSAGQWKTFRIQLSKLPGGAKTHLMVINTPDKKTGAAASEYRNIRLYEDGAAARPLELSKLVFDVKQGGGKVSVTGDGTTLSLVGDIRIKAALAYTVTEKSILEFDFQSNAQGLVHGIGLDTDEQFDYRWVQRDWSAKTHAMPREPSVPMRLAMEMLEGLKKEFSLDESRLYVTGLSMGGYGTWDLIARKPAMFAAAVPVCGGADETTAPMIKDLPIWVFHGGADTVVPTLRSRNMIEALKKAGGNPKYTEYPGVGHNSWSKAYSDMEMIRWMLSQKR